MRLFGFLLAGVEGMKQFVEAEASLDHRFDVLDAAQTGRLGDLRLADHAGKPCETVSVSPKLPNNEKNTFLFANYPTGSGDLGSMSIDSNPQTLQTRRSRLQRIASRTSMESSEVFAIGDKKESLNRPRDLRRPSAIDASVPTLSSNAHETDSQPNVQISEQLSRRPSDSSYNSCCPFRMMSKDSLPHCPETHLEEDSSEEGSSLSRENSSIGGNRAGLGHTSLNLEKNLPEEFKMFVPSRIHRMSDPQLSGRLRRSPTQEQVQAPTPHFRAVETPHFGASQQNPGDAVPSTGSLSTNELTSLLRQPSKGSANELTSLLRQPSLGPGFAFRQSLGKSSGSGSSSRMGGLRDRLSMRNGIATTRNNGLSVISNTMPETPLRPKPVLAHKTDLRSQPWRLAGDRTGRRKVVVNLVLARHGERTNEWKDPALTKKGKDTSALLAARTKPERGFDAVLVSPMRRTWQTALRQFGANNMEKLIVTPFIGEGSEVAAGPQESFFGDEEELGPKLPDMKDTPLVNWGEGLEEKEIGTIKKSLNGEFFGFSSLMGTATEEPSGEALEELRTKLRDGGWTGMGDSMKLLTEVLPKVALPLAKDELNIAVTTHGRTLLHWLGGSQGSSPSPFNSGRIYPVKFNQAFEMKVTLHFNDEEVVNVVVESSGDPFSPDSELLGKDLLSGSRLLNSKKRSSSLHVHSSGLRSGGSSGIQTPASKALDPHVLQRSKFRNREIEIFEKDSDNSSQGSPLIVDGSRLSNALANRKLQVQLNLKLSEN